MFKNILVGVLLLITGSLLAQEGTTSPYSFYGVGTQRFKGTAESRAMAGLSVFADSIHINLQNPAAYGSLRLVNFSLAASHQFTQQKNSTESQNVSTTTFDYLVMGIPMGKAGVGFGIKPYSSVGYHFLSEAADRLHDYTGNGGLNRAFLSLGYQITPEFSLGAEGNYNFGKITSTSIFQVRDVQYGTRVTNNSELSGFSASFGAIYKRMINNKLEISGAATYSLVSHFNSDDYRKFETISILPVGIVVIDSRDEVRTKSEFKMPSEFSIGGAISRPKHWGLGAEFKLQEASDYTNSVFSTDKVSYKSANKFSLGGYYIPNYISFGKYFQRVNYRAGIRYEQTGVSVDGHEIDEFGISFGLGMPVGRLFSNVNLGFEIGRRGTTNYGLIQENFFNTYLSFSLNDRWFEKRFIN